MECHSATELVAFTGIGSKRAGYLMGMRVSWGAWSEMPAVPVSGPVRRPWSTQVCSSVDTLDLRHRHVGHWKIYGDWQFTSG